jgi:hypothetical protein
MTLQGMSPTADLTILNSIVSNSDGYAQFVDIDAKIINCTIADNHSLGVPIIYSVRGDLEITNSILWNNSSVGGDYQISITDNSSLNISHSDVQGGVSGIQSDGASSVTYDPSNIDADPLFMNPNDPLSDDLMVQSGSPVIDAGTHDAWSGIADRTDISGNARFVDIAPSDTDHNFVDMGAYESQNLIVTPDEVNNPI